MFYISLKHNDIRESFKFMYKTWTSSLNQGTVFIKKSELADYINKSNRSYDVSNIRNTISNLRKLIKGSGLEDIILLDNFSRKNSAYPFTIKLPISK